MDERKLFTNTFINKDIYNVKDNTDKYLKEQEEFKRFIENKNPDIGNINFVTSAQQKSNIVEKSETIQDMIEENNNLIKNDIKYDNKKSLLNDDSHLQLRKKYININSSDRNKSLYPNPNNYKINLNKQKLGNIISIKLKETLFRNTEQTIYKAPIDKTNNKIHFSLFRANYDNIVTYTATLNYGSYTFEELSKELERAMNFAIKQEGTYYDFYMYVTVDSEFNLVVFRTYKSKAIGNSLRFKAFTDGFDTVFTNTFDVVWKNHNISVGDRIQLLNVDTDDISRTIGLEGDTPIVIDIEFEWLFIVSQVINSNTIRIFVPYDLYFIPDGAGWPTKTIISKYPPSYNYFLYCGGQNIEGRVLLDMEIYFDVSPKLADLLNFPPLTLKSKEINVEAGVYKEFRYSLIGQITVPGAPPEEEFSVRSLFIEYINNDYNINNNINTNSFNLNYVLPYLDGERTLINTTTDHNLETGDRIIIWGGGTTSILTIYNDDNTTSDITGITYFYTYLDGSLTEPTPKDSSNQTIRDNFEQALTLSDGYLIDVIDNRNFSILKKYEDYEIEDPDNPGEYITMSAYTEREIVGVTPESRGTILLNSRTIIDVDGKDYIYMLSDQLGGNFTSTNESDKLKTIYSKLLFSGESGDMCYNTYVGGQKFYYDTPLNILTELDFQFRDSNGDLYDFNDIDHSFTLEILEVVQKVEKTEYNTRFGDRIII